MMINETLLLGIIISPILVFAAFCVTWRYLHVPKYFQSDSNITTCGGTMTNSIDFGTNTSIITWLLGPNPSYITMDDNDSTVSH